MTAQSPWMSSLLKPLHIAMFGVAILAGLISAWWLMPIGVVLWVVMVANLATSPAMRLNQEMAGRKAVSNRFQRQFDQIERVEVRLFNLLGESDKRTRLVLKPVQDGVDSLVDQAHSLLLRIAAMENYRLVSQGEISELRLEKERMDTVLKYEEDEAKRKRYQESLKSIEERLARLDAASSELDRVEFQLKELQNTLDIVYGEVVRIQALDPDTMKAEIPALLERLDGQRYDLNELGRQAGQY